MARILIIEDDPVIGETLRDQLLREGFEVHLVTNGRKGLSEASTGGYHLILLDLMLPLLDGMHVLKRLREAMITTPVIIETAKNTEAEKIDGFLSGCDDYVTKPFSLLELIARINAVLRRSGFRENRLSFHLDELRFNPDEHSIHRNQTQIAVTRKEFELLYTLACHPNQTLSRDFLLNQIWGEETESNNRTIDTHVASLRAKLEQAGVVQIKITTSYKVGYKLIV